MIRGKIKIISIFFCYLGITSCSLTSHLGNDELLLKKSEIRIKNQELVKKKKRLISALSTYAKPATNSGLFKMRLRLHNAIKPPKANKGLKYWLKYKVGESPALFNSQIANRNRLQMEKHLKDNGFFRSTVSFDTIVQDKKIKVLYTVTSKGQYKLKQIYFPNDTSILSAIINKNKEERLLKSGSFYHNQDLEKERLRLSKLIRDHGYFDFKPDYINFFVDTISGELLTNLYIKIRLNQNKPHPRYRLDETLVFTNYDLNELPSTKNDTFNPGAKFYIIEDNKIINHTLLNRMILQQPEDFFAKTSQDASVNHLLDLGTFKFVNLKYDRKIDSLENKLDRFFYLTPDLSQDIALDFELNNRTGGYYGTATTLSYLHKNLFYGAERLNASLTGGLETQFDKDLSFINTLDVNLQLKYSVPKFLIPFKVNYYSGYYVPRSSLTLNNNFQKRAGFYSIYNTILSFGYEWKESAKKLHQLNPIDFQMVRVFNTTPEFEALLSETTRLRQSFENTFIGGLNYIFNYGDQNTGPGTSNIFFRGEIKMAGNLFYLYHKITNSQSKPAFELFGQPFSQFIKLQADLRWHKRNQKNSLVARFAPGFALPYGNSEVLPYNEQFYIGGANSIRAFKLRRLGPGKFIAPETDSEIAGQFLDQTGDIRLEMNMEYRFDLFGYVKGATFIDAGNIWLIESDETPEGVFHLNQFVNQIAVGSGVGLRLDFDFAVIRMDLGIALRKPYTDAGFKWSFNQWNFKSKDFRQDHLNWVFAIGYPF